MERRVIYGIAGAVVLSGIAYALSLASKPVFSEGPVLSTNPPHDDQAAQTNGELDPRL
jgi:hypothetical protein